MAGGQKLLRSCARFRASLVFESRVFEGEAESAKNRVNYSIATA